MTDRTKPQIDEGLLKMLWGETAVGEYHENVIRLVRATEGHDHFMIELDYDEAVEMLNEACEHVGLLAASNGMSLTAMVDVMVAILSSLAKNRFTVVPSRVVIGLRYMFSGVISGD